jgi:hypothetical protein
MLNLQVAEQAFRISCSITTVGDGIRTRPLKALPPNRDLPFDIFVAILNVVCNFIDVAFENGDTGRGSSAAHLPVWLNLSAANFHREYEYCHRGALATKGGL